MYTHFITIIFITLMSLILLILSLTNQFSQWSYNMLTMFECGFNQHKFMHKSFSLQIFLMLMVFVCFDLEIIFLSIMANTMQTNMISIFIIMIYLTLILEFWFSTITWKL